jgi:cytochrome P450
MNAVLLESMRTAALVGPGVPHYTTDNIPVGDYVIPKGAVIFGSLYHAMNDPEYFVNPHRFDPERFLKSGKFVSDDRVKMSTNRFSPRR